MDNNEHRQIARDSLFVMAELRLDGIAGEHRVRIRNLSSGGFMAEGNLSVRCGQGLWVNLRNLGWTEGSVAWVQDNRFGVAFRDEIDPRLARGPAPVAVPDPDLLVRRPLYASAADPGPARDRLRKI